MKPWQSILAFLLLVMVSCQRPVEHKSPHFEFDTNWGLKEEQEEAIRNDSAIMAAFRFYDSILPGTSFTRANRDLAFRKAKVYYGKAVVEEVKTLQHVEAFSDYLNALWLMDGLTGKRHFLSPFSVIPEYEHFTALIYDKLAWILYTYDAWDVAMECLEQSSECFEKENNLRGIASNYELMGDVLLAHGDRLGSLVYYKKSDSINEQLQNDDNLLNFNRLFCTSLDLYNSGEPKASKDLLFYALDMSDNYWQRRKVHFSLGQIYYENKEYDSALYHYEQGYPLLPRQNIKSYCHIIKAANELGDTIKAARYGEMLSDYCLKRVAQSGSKTRMVMMYEAAKAEKKEVRQKDLTFFILLIVGLLVIILVADSILIEHRRRSHRNEIETQEKVKALLEDEIETAKKDSRHKEEKIRSLEIELKNALSNPDFQKLPFDKKLETLYAMPISKRVCLVKEANVKAGVSYPEMVLSENQMTKLVNAVDAVFSKFSVRIIEKYPRLKRLDVVYCCMYVLGITEVQAAALTGKTYQAVWTRSLKLHEIFENDSNLQLVLHDFLKSW